MDKYIEERYKDFRELPNNCNEQDLRRLFVKRNYSDYIEDKMANNIKIETDDNVSTFEERMALKKKKAVIAFQFPESTSIDSAEYELSSLKPLEITNRYLRERVEAYLELCHKIINELKPAKSFPQYLNIPDKKKEDFAQELKKEFCNEKGIAIRFMIEGLIDNHVLTIGHLQKKEITNSLREYFNRDIGTNSGILDIKRDAKDYYNSRIKTAELRIKSILKKLHIYIE